MRDLTEKYLPDLKKQKNAHLDLGASAFYPSFDGCSLLNLPSTLCSWFNTSRLPHPRLDLVELDELAQDIHQVIVVLIDAVSHRRFLDWLAHTQQTLQSTLEDALIFPLTTVVPSTTCSVLTTLWTGRSPAEHGILGYELFLKEYGLIANMITHSPASFDGRPGLLYQAGFEPEKVLPVSTLGTYLSNAGINTYALLSRDILKSGLSRMHYASVSTYGFRTATDLWIQARHLAELKRSTPRFIWIYYGSVDNYSHIYGPDSEQAEIEFVTFLNLMQKSFLTNLSSEARRKTLLLILSDHGQIHTVQNPHYDLSNHPSLVSRLHMLPTGENRLAYLYPRPGQSEAVYEYVSRTWPSMFKCVSSSYALESGLFGPGKPAKVALNRIGDTILISQEDAYLWWSSKTNHLIGRHGGVSEDEMVVPLLALRLD